MRLLTFSFLKKCKYLHVSLIRLNNKYSSAAGSVKPAVPEDKGGIEESANLVEVHSSWPEDVEVELRTNVIRDLQVLPGFVTEQEEASIMAELEPYLRKMRYEFDHWDNAIHGYRETERLTWKEENALILSRVRETAFSAPGSGEPLDHAHVLDLAAGGHIAPHIDATRFCGEVIAGMCLLSTAVMRLAHPERTELAVDALLPQRCLYVLRGAARYRVTHAVLGAGDSVWRGRRVPRARRVSVIVRSRPTETFE